MNSTITVVFGNMALSSIEMRPILPFWVYAIKIFKITVFQKV